MTAEEVVGHLQRTLAQSPPDGVSVSQVRRFFAAGRDELIAVVQETLGAWLSKSDGGMTASARTAANLTALRVLSRLRAGRGRASPEEAAMLRAYSGWGGLSIEKVRDSDWPDGLKPEVRGLIHEYYTPRVVTDAIATLVQRLRPTLPSSGKIRALEPSAGVGRFVDSVNTRLGSAALDWQLCEWSALSAAILNALFPGVVLHQGPFESWVAQNGDALFDLVVANPPYDKRGVSIADDPVRDYRDRRAYAYFLRRASDLLAPGGLAVWLIPAGFMTGTSAASVELRRKVLLRHHLELAYRLPSVRPGGGEALFPGAMLVTDVVVLRARGGELANVLPSDQAVLNGQFFAQRPEALLGREIGRDAGDDDQTRKPRFGYQVEGEFTGLPDLPMRPIEVAPLREFRASKVKRVRGAVRDAVGASLVLEGASEAVRIASALGMRIDRYLSLVSSGQMRVAVALHGELLDDVQAWVRAGGMTSEVVGWLQRDDGVGRLLANVSRAGVISPAVKLAPLAPKTPFTGQVSDSAAVLRWLAREGSPVTEAQLVAALLDIRGPKASVLYDEAVRAGWGLDPVSGALLPPSIAWYGDLWTRHDASVAAAGKSSPIRAHVNDQAWSATMRAQAGRLRLLIAPVSYEGVGSISPMLGWIPVELIEGWLAVKTNTAISLERAETLRLRGLPYSELSKLPQLAQQVLGWINHDRELFDPPKPNRDTKTDDVRLALAAQWNAEFQAWVEQTDGAPAKLVAAYNRIYRGHRPQEYSGEDLGIARWGDRIRLNSHQIAGAQRVLALKGGLVAFGVGVGKTFTACAIVARAKQERQARRPVVLVPNTLVFQWKASFEKALPDYRVLVIGANAKVGKDGKVRSVLDTPRERSEKWSAFQAGLWDVVILSYSAFGRTRISLNVVEEFAHSSSPLKRVAQEETTKAAESLRKAKGKVEELTERQRAVMQEGAAGLIRLRLELPESWEYDPGPAWDELGIDMLVVDEAQNYKNWWLPAAREHGIPKFMGNAGDGSSRAWQLAVRAFAVRRTHEHGKGVVLLSATPAKNSPLEFYSLLSYLGDKVWESFGVYDSEQFIDQFCQLEKRDIISPALSVVSNMACVGFKNLDALRTVLFTHGEFKTSRQVGLKVPEPRPESVMVEMNALQERIYNDTAAELQDLLKSGGARRNPGAMLKALGRLNAAALHPELVKVDGRDPWTYEAAVKAAREPGFALSSPKLEACAQRVSSKPACGHVVFCDFVAIHAWLREVLIRRGIPASRIAVMNAQTAKSSADRVRMAEAFNNADFDVIIVNAVAYEGIDLQKRTCSLHHLDLPWEPATLEQRNGRGARQGNEFSEIAIYVYMASRSVDGLRFQTISGKRRWMEDVIEGSASAINNPGAQVGVSEDDLLIALSRDPEKTAVQVAKMKAERSAEAEWSAHVRRMAAFGSALRRATAGGLDEVEQYISQELATVEASPWSWAPWARRALERGGLLGELPTQRPSKASTTFGTPAILITGSVLNGNRVGRIAGNRLRILLGQHSIRWTEADLKTVKTDNFGPTDVVFNAPPSPLVSESLTREFSARGMNAETWRELRWAWADDEWIAQVWPSAERFIRSRWREDQDAPRRLNNHLSLEAGELIAPDSAGWAWFVSHATDLVKTASWKQLYEVGMMWWGRSLPRDALVVRELADSAPAALGGTRSRYASLYDQAKRLRDGARATEDGLYALLGESSSALEDRIAIEAEASGLADELRGAMSTAEALGETLDPGAVERRLAALSRRWSRLGDMAKPAWLRSPATPKTKKLGEAFAW